MVLLLNSSKGMNYLYLGEELLGEAPVNEPLFFLLFENRFMYLPPAYDLSFLPGGRIYMLEESPLDLRFRDITVLPGGKK